MTSQMPEELEKYTARFRYDIRRHFRLDPQAINDKPNRVDDDIFNSYRKLLNEIPNITCPIHQVKPAGCELGGDGHHRKFAEYLVFECCCKALTDEIIRRFPYHRLELM